MERFDFEPGQFISVVAQDDRGKSQTRAYSMASVASGARFDLCVDRVDGGFFSNLLCSLEVGEPIQFHGPHGTFLLRKPPTDSIFIAAETGIAPIRGFVQSLFASGEGLLNPAHDHEFWLIYGARSQSELYYREYFERVAASHANFHYLPTLNDAYEDWQGHSEPVHELARKIIAERDRFTPSQSEVAADELQSFHVYAYICGLNEMVSRSREVLKELGWQRKQIVFERYN